ncbi:MAG TPA: hypothetical protein VE176_05745, partial [Candidatus Limnocylindrales bacterium]|nr:hypothetical protein [Candidatus Limnocylindrales bacterium]
IAISTNGNSPALSQNVRKKLENEFGPEYESWTAWLGRMRDMMRKVLPRTDRRKELLMLLAHCKPVKLLNKSIHGGNHGPLEKIRAGSQTEARAERASA